MNKNILYGFAGFVIISIFAAAVYAFPFDNFAHRNVVGDQKVRNAIESGDYQTYLDAFNSVKLEPMNETEFQQRSSHMRHMEDEFANMTAKRKAVEDAMEAGDYQAWLKAIEDSPRSSELKTEITEEKFAVLIQIHKAKESGDFDKAKELAETAGISLPMIDNARGPRGISGHRPYANMLNHGVDCPSQEEQSG